VIDTRGFRFGKVRDLRDENFLPGGAKYGDLPCILALAAPRKVWIAGESEATIAFAKSQYAAAGADQHLVVFDGAASRMRDAALTWLLTAD
jgi:hypothetical protein